MGIVTLGKFWRRNEGWGLKEKEIRYIRNATLLRNSGVRVCTPAKFYLEITKKWEGMVGNLMGHRKPTRFKIQYVTIKIRGI